MLQLVKVELILYIYDIYIYCYWMNKIVFKPIIKQNDNHLLLQAS